MSEEKIYLSWTGFFSSPEFSAVSNVEGLKLKITAHKTFKNKFDQIRAGIKFIYRENTSVIGYSVFRQTNMQRFDRQFFHAAMQANVFSIEKTHQHNLFWREIHSFASITDRN